MSRKEILFAGLVKAIVDLGRSMGFEVTESEVGDALTEMGIESFDAFTADVLRRASEIQLEGYEEG